MKIGLMSSTNTRLRGGPMAFMDRLEQELINRGLYSTVDFDVWLNLSFRPIPEFVRNKNIPIIVRYDGVWNDLLFQNNSFYPLNKINEMYFSLRNRVLLKNSNLASGCIFQSYFCQGLAEKYLQDISEVKKSAIIYNGVDIDRFSPAGSVKRSDSKKSINILVSHKMWPTKRFFQIPSIVRALKDDGMSVNVNVLGDGIRNPYDYFVDTLQFFKKEVRAFSVENEFNFLGHIPHNKLSEIYKRNDIMLNLSFADPCPNVVVEAMACGLPVVGPASGGLGELVGGSNTLVKENIDPFKKYSTWRYSGFPVIDVADYVSVIYETLSNYNYESQRVRIIAEEKYNIKNVADKYIEFMSSFL